MYDIIDDYIGQLIKLKIFLENSQIQGQAFKYNKNVIEKVAGDIFV